MDYNERWCQNCDNYQSDECLSCKERKGASPSNWDSP